MTRNQKALNQEGIKRASNFIISNSEMDINTPKKDSFILYKDYQEIFNALTDEQAGVLIKGIFNYLQNENTKLDSFLNVVFIPIRQQLERDAKKYTQTIEKRRVAGSKGGKQRVANQANATFAKKFQANQADNDNDNDNDNVNDNDINNKNIYVHFETFWNLYPNKVNKKNALKAYEKAIKKENPDVILQGLEKYIAHINAKKIDKQYIKHPTTWINGECWNDEYAQEIEVSNGWNL